MLKSTSITKIWILIMWFFTTVYSEAGNFSFFWFFIGQSLRIVSGTLFFWEPRCENALSSELSWTFSWKVWLPSFTCETNVVFSLWQKATRWETRAAFLQYSSLVVCFGSLQSCHAVWIHWGGDIRSGQHKVPVAIVSHVCALCGKTLGEREVFYSK